MGMSGGEGGREREGDWESQAGSALPAQNPMLDLNKLRDHALSQNQESAA